MHTSPPSSWRRSVAWPLVLVAALAAQGGCVPKGKYELVEIQLDATRAAVSARAAQTAEHERELEIEVKKLEEQIVLRQAQLDLLTVREELSDRQLASARSDLKAAREALAQIQAGEGVDVPAQAPQEDVDAALLAARFVSTREAFAPVRDRVELFEEGHHLVVRVPWAQLVQEGWTSLSPRGEVLAEGLIEALQQIPGVPIRIEGHTDSTPKHSAAYPSNWERGFGAALLVLRAIEARQLPLGLSAASVAGTRPLPGVAPAAPEQQRVELWINLSPAAQHAYAPSSAEEVENGDEGASRDEDVAPDGEGL